MKFQYIGDKKEAPEIATAFGYTFELKGEPVEITDNFVIEKLKGNKTFKVIDGGVEPETLPEEPVLQEPVPTPEPELESVVEFEKDPFAAVEEGLPGGVEPDNFGDEK